MAVQNATNMSRIQFLNGSSTGVLSGGVLSINGGDNSKFDLTAGTGRVVDNYTDPQDPSTAEISFSAQTAVTVTNLATDPQTFIAINSSGSIVQQTNEFTQDQKRDLITLGVLGHPNNTTITSVGNLEQFGADVGVQFGDLATALGNINISGNVYVANGANLNMDKSSGSTFRLGGNFNNSKKLPNNVTDGSLVGLSFLYQYQDGSGGFTTTASTTSVDPDQYDDGSGTLATVPNNKWTIQKITFFTNSDLTVVSYGQNIYDKLTDAESSIQTEVFVSNPNLERGSFRAWLIVEKGCTDLSNTSECKFIAAGKFGSASASGGSSGAGLTDLQTAYNNSVTPEIIVDASRGALSIQDNATPIGAALFEVQSNGGGTTYFDVDASGANIDGALTITTALAVAYGGTGSTSFTAGSVPFSNGTILTQDNSNLFWDETNKRLGIGNAAPQDTLHVTGNSRLTHTAAQNDDHALEIDCDAAGFGDVKAIDIVYTTGAISTGENEEAILVNIDESDSVGGEVAAFEVLTTAEGGASQIAGLKTGAQIDPVVQEAGVFGDADTVLNNAVDITSSVSSGGGGGITVFASNSDTMTIGNSDSFGEIEVILATGAFFQISPTFEYSTGVGTWATFSPTDGTNGFVNSGAILWDVNDLSGFAPGTGSEYLIRITRTSAFVFVDPVVDLIQISDLTEYKWDKSGNLSINTITTSDLTVSDQEFKQATVQTTDATVTQIAAITLTTNEMVSVEARIIGLNSAFGDCIGGRIFYTARRVAGSAIEVSEPIVDIQEDAAGTLLIDADVSGNDIRLLVQGIGGTTYNWKASYNFTRS